MRPGTTAQAAVTVHRRSGSSRYRSGGAAWRRLAGAERPAAGYQRDGSHRYCGSLQVQRHHPAVIILDVMMPEMDGLAFLRQLRANPNTQKIPVVLLTANRYLPDKDLLTQLGVVETISKPFLPVNLVRQIDKALLN